MGCWFLDRAEAAYGRIAFLMNFVDFCFIKLSRVVVESASLLVEVRAKV